MADIVDQANEVSDLLTQSAISNRVKPMPVAGMGAGRSGFLPAGDVVGANAANGST